MKKHLSRFLTLVQDVKPQIRDVAPETLKAKIDNKEKFYLIDVREDIEWNISSIPTAIHLSKGVIERDIEKQISDLDAEIIVFCSGGFRAVLTADNLQKMGYSNVTSLANGLSGWVAANYPLCATK